ncbi:AcrR family transcriptional regulator [Dietzia sp. 2505]|uniref:TetR/AcrR family transcriptional regulator n=1 Tax=Dietzia sp. 2505 TaxID=3156457 RepID=UPI0033926143
MARSARSSEAADSASRPDPEWLGWDSTPAADDLPPAGLGPDDYPGPDGDPDAVDRTGSDEVSTGDSKPPSTASSRSPESSEPRSGSGAHRPSRRHLIVQAAVRVFSRKGFAEAAIQEIAQEAGMVPTAVYYHFASKEELFESALGYAMDASSAAAQTARPDDVSAGPESFRDVLGAVWDWTAEHPNSARMLFLQMAGGATPGTRLLTREYEERHIRRAFDYFPVSDDQPNRRAATAQHAARSLRVRTVIATTIAIQPLRIEGGPLADVPEEQLRTATGDVCTRMIVGR